MKLRSKAFRHSLTSVRRAGPKIQRRDSFNACLAAVALAKLDASTVCRFNFSVSYTLQELASMSGGELVGDPKLKITGAASLAEATSGEISFFGNRNYIGLLRKTRASAVFVPPDFGEPLTADQIRVANPTKAFEQVV